jgi:DNA-binding MarR family transcriptional regulator
MATDASPPYRFGDLLALARRSWIRQVRSRMEEAGFADYRQTDAWMVRLLVRRPWAIGQLGEAMGVTRQAARQLADGMVERGYACFGTDPQDARRTLVVLTPSGESYARAVWQAQDALNNALRDRVSAADLAAADAVLRAVFPGDQARRRLDESIPPPTPR